MGCIKDIQCGSRTIIGIRDYNLCNNPESGLFINDIPGITLKNASNIANEEQKSGYELLNEIIKRAILLTFEDFYSEISPRFAFNLIDTVRDLRYFSNATLAPVALDRGLVLKRWRSEMAQIFVQDIIVKSATAGAAIIKIIDGVTTTTFNVTLIANQEYILRVDYIAKSESIKIVMDDTAKSVYSGDINSSYSGCNTCGGGSVQGFYVSGWNGSSEDSKYYGIGVLASVRCYEENIICQLLSRMNFIFWYRAGMLYYDELLSSNRLNNITIFTKERAVENLADLTEKYNKAYKNFIPTILSFVASTKGECFKCNPTIKYANTTP